MKRTTLIAIIALLGVVARADVQHTYPTNPDPDNAAFFGQLGRDSLVVTNPIVRTVDGSGRYTPKYLWVYDCADSYPAEAEEYYRSRGDGKVDGGCSSVRSGGFFSRNFDFPFDNRSEFVVKMSAGAGRFESVGVSQVGTNLTEAIVTSGKPEYSRLYKWLPGATMDGINEKGVACCINMVDGDPQWGGGVSPALHPLAAIRWILDHATNAQHGATYIASHISFPQGWTQDFHYMVADATSTYIVENGEAYPVGAGASRPRVALTNFRLYPTPSDGEGRERYVALTNGANITSQWWTLTYTASGYRPSDLPGITGEDLTNLFNYWASKPREAHRGESFNGTNWWQSIHTSIYDLTNRTLRVAVQETDDWYTFSLRSDGVPAVDEGKVGDIVRPMIASSTNNLRRVTDMAMYERTLTEWVFSGDIEEGVTYHLTSLYEASDNTTVWYLKGGTGGDLTVTGRPEEWAHLVIGLYDGERYVVADRQEVASPSTNAVLSAVVTNGAFAVATGDLMKLGANGSLVKATAGIDYSTPSGVETAIEEYDRKIDIEGLRQEVDAVEGGLTEAVSIARTANEKADLLESNKADRATTLSGYGITDGATKTEVNDAKAAANEANVWSSAVYNFMTGGRTNCWFSGTNYVFGTDAAARTRFSWEDGMDVATVPCSMALWEIRDGERQLVWDQRDWTAWYWSFKANQMQTEIQGRIDTLGNTVTNDANYAWAKRYASDGTPNPDASTTFIDTPSVTLSPGMKWETVATVSGAAYWTIVGDGAIIGGSGTNAVLRIQDFEGNDIMTVTKGEHRLAWIERGEITGQMYDGDGRVCFDMLADAEPVGYFSTTLDSSDFLPQTDPNCPAQYEWEDLHNGKYRIHYLLKPGIQSNACFAKFQVEVEGQTIIRYNAGQEISGGLIYNGVKIAPDISGSPAVGTVIQWKVVR